MTPSIMAIAVKALFEALNVNDTEHKDTQHNDTQHIDTQHNDNRRKGLI
jgi:hypothetical protein